VSSRRKPARPGLALWAGELRATLRLAGPLVTLQLATVVIGTTDVVMLGRLGPGPLAAGSLGISLELFLFLGILGVLLAVQPMAAQALGGGDAAGFARAVRQGLWTAALLGLPAMLLLWWSGPLFLLLGQEPATAALAQDYLRAKLWSFLPGLWFVVLRSGVAVAGRAGPLWVLPLGGILLNGFANWLLIFGNLGLPALGVVGAGLASSMVWSAMLAALAAYALLQRDLRGHRLLAGLRRPDRKALARLFAIGLPIGAVLLAEASLVSVSMIVVGWFGATQMAGHAVALRCVTVATMIPVGIGEAATIRSGLAAGAGDWPALGRVAGAALALLLALTVPIALLLVFASDRVAWLFLGPLSDDNRAAYAAATAFLPYAGLFQCVNALLLLFAGLLRGLEDTRAAMTVAVPAYLLIGFGGGVLLGEVYGLRGSGAWTAMILSVGFQAAIVVHRFLNRERLGLSGVTLPIGAASRK